MNDRIKAWPLPLMGVGTGLWDWDERKASAQALGGLVAAALETGSPFFDTAPIYGYTFSEQRLGELLRGVPRASYFLSSKTGYSIQDEQEEGKTDLSRDGLLRSLEGSLKRLGTDYLDILHLHDPDCCQEQALVAAFPLLLELRAQGLVRAVGAGMNQWQMLAEFARQVDLDCCLLAGRYTLLEQESRSFLDLCAEKGIAVFLGGVYNTGILASGAVAGARYQYQPAPPAIMERVRRMQDVCARYQVPLHAAALQFALGHPAVRTLVVGLVSAAELRTAQEGLAAAIPAGLWQEMQAEGLIASDAQVIKR